MELNVWLLKELPCGVLKAVLQGQCGLLSPALHVLVLWLRTADEVLVRLV